MGARLYVIPASHAAATGRLLLEHKGIPYKRVDLPPVAAKLITRGLGFPGNTVPALEIDGRRVQGTRLISRELERIQPEPALFPADPEARAAVEEAERFGDEELQPVFRTLPYWALRRNPESMLSYAEGSKLAAPPGLARRASRPVVWLFSFFTDASDENVRRDIARLATHLRRIDEWIEAGVLNGERLNAADLQIAPSLRLAMTFDDLRPAIEGRPAGELAMRALPEFPGAAPPAFPPAWLQPLRDETAAAPGDERRSRPET
jgi:glutathione S-transferase